VESIIQGIAMNQSLVCRKGKTKKSEVFDLSVADPDPASGAFLTQGSGIGKKSRSGSRIRIRDEHPGSYFRELRSNFLG
jgi:hypothetical protein